MEFARLPAAGGALYAMMIGAALSGCVFTGETGPRPPENGGHAGMKRIPAIGKSFKQGGTGPFAKPDEKPVNTVSFSADFWMDSVEVTQSLFREMTGREPVPASSPYGSGADHPVHGVTWYDAILFCNARSKSRGLDTVYAYTGVSLTRSGAAYAIAGLSVHPERKGFRLPTEAEWEFSANAGKESAFPWGEQTDSTLAGKQAWYSENSGNRSHPVGTLSPNAFGLHDMAGNVMEWVNDWKGPYPGTSITDFAGARDPGSRFEKPVKGGAFNYGLPDLRTANRSATYATIPSAATEYVGFRCVIGGIDKPVYYSQDGKRIDTHPFSPAISRIHVPLSGMGAKLVFVNASTARRQLAYVDFRSSPPLVKEFTDFAKVFHPVISPDGEWAAFCTGMEGSEERSEVFVRRLDSVRSEPIKVGEGFIPRWWVDEAKRDTFLIYATTAVDNREMDRWLGSRTMLQKFAAGGPSGPPISLTDAGGFHDGRSRGGRFLATGFRLLKMRDGETGLTSTLFTAPENGKAARDTSQVCNVSIAPDSTGNTLFLDFGYAGKSTLVGSEYGIHQVAFLGAPSGKVGKWFRAPAGEESWNDLEWSNHPDFAVAAAINPAGEQKNIYLLNLRDSVYSNLVGGTNLIQPGLWVSAAEGGQVVPGGLDLDSLGLYDDPATFDGQAVLAIKMHYFWKFRESMEGFFLGSSQMADGFDPREVASLKALNMAYGAGGMGAVRLLIRDYILPHAPKTKMIGISVPLGWFNVPGADIKWHEIIAGNKGFLYDANHGHWRGGLPADFTAAMMKVPFPARGHVDSLVLLSFPSQGWGPGIMPEARGITWGVSDPTYIKNMEDFENLIVELSKLKIHCLFMTFPQSPAFKGLLSYSSQGPSRITARAIIKDMQSLQDRYPYFHFLDLNQDGDHGYLPEDAFDDNHLSGTGAKKLSKALDARIRAILTP